MCSSYFESPPTLFLHRAISPSKMNSAHLFAVMKLLLLLVFSSKRSLVCGGRTLELQVDQAQLIFSYHSARSPSSGPQAGPDLDSSPGRTSTEWVIEWKTLSEHIDALVNLCSSLSVALREPTVLSVFNLCSAALSAVYQFRR